VLFHRQTRPEIFLRGSARRRIICSWQPRQVVGVVAERGGRVRRERGGQTGGPGDYAGQEVRGKLKNFQPAQCGKGAGQGRSGGGPARGGCGGGV